MQYNQKQLNTPVLFIIFNRPETTSRVFEEIRKAQPKQLFISADGPRTMKENDLCDEARKLTEKIDWSCDVKRKYSDKNLGCKIGVSSAIDWFFENVEEGIILEDDVLPDQSFFQFCEELLKRYKNNNKITSISGSNPFDQKIDHNSDYFFSKYTRIWGWATWKRSWEDYDVNISSWAHDKKQKNHYKLFDSKREALYWEKFWDKCYEQTIDTWDYQWLKLNLYRQSLTIIASKNLVSNIGFGIDATHTKSNNNPLSNRAKRTITFPLIHPEKVIANIENDTLVSKSYNKKCFIFSTMFKKLLG